MSIDGTWNIKMETPMGTRQNVLTLKTEGCILIGTMGGDSGATELYDGTVSGDQATWKANMTQPMALTLEFSASFTGDVVSGSVKLGMFGNAPVAGQRA